MFLLLEQEQLVDVPAVLEKFAKSYRPRITSRPIGAS
jgi:hypothetical protein